MKRTVDRAAERRRRRGDGLPPAVAVGAPTLQRLGRSRRVRVYATSSERGTIGASGFLDVAGLTLPVKKVPRRRVRVGGGGAVLTYTLERVATGAPARRALRRGRPVRPAPRRGRHRPGRQLEQRADAPRIRLELRRASAVADRPARRTPSPGTSDGDEVRDEVDNCPTVKNGSQINTDGDGPGDACDSRRRQRRRARRRTTTAASTATPTKRTATATAIGDACPPVRQRRGRGHRRRRQLPTVSNPDQSDLDGDDNGDACDRDDDGDRFDDALRQLPDRLQPRTRATSNGDGLINDQLDRDGDGIGTACDADEPVIQARRPAATTAPATAKPGHRAPPRTGRRARRPGRPPALLGGVRNNRGSGARPRARRGDWACAGRASWPAARPGSRAPAPPTRSCDSTRARGARCSRQRRIRGLLRAVAVDAARQPPRRLASDSSRPLTQSWGCTAPPGVIDCAQRTRVWQRKHIGGDSSGIFHPGVGAGVAGWCRIDSLPGHGACHRLGRQRGGASTTAAATSTDRCSVTCRPRSRSSRLSAGSRSAASSATWSRARSPTWRCTTATPT